MFNDEFVLNIGTVLRSLGPQSDWLPVALKEDGYDLIEKLAKRTTVSAGAPLSSIGAISGKMIALASDRIRSLPISDSDGRVGGLYVAFIYSLVEEVSRCRADSSRHYASEIKQLNSIMALTCASQLAESKEQVIAIYQKFTSQTSFYGDAQLEGDVLARWLGATLVIETHIEGSGSPPIVVQLGVAPSPGVPKIVFHRSQSDNPERHRLDHFNLHSINGQIIPHMIPGTGNCLFEAFAQMVLESFLLYHESTMEEGHRQTSMRREAQKRCGIKHFMIQDMSAQGSLSYLPGGHSPVSPISRESSVYKPAAVREIQQEDSSLETAVSEQAEHREEMLKRFKNLYSASATSAVHQAYSASAQTVPYLDAKGSVLEWNDIFNIQQASQYLNMSRVSESCRKISPSDLKKIVEFCDYKAWISLTDRRRLAKYAFRILSYIAEHKWRLSPPAFNALYEELKKQDLLTLNHVILALSYSIHNRVIDIKVDVQENLYQGIKKLKGAGQKEYSSTILIGLSALSMNGLGLDEEDIRFISHQLIDVKSKSTLRRHPLYDDASRFLRSTNSSSSGLSFFRTQYKELKLIQRLSREGQDVSTKQLKYLTRQYDNTQHIKTRTRLLRSVRYITQNGQQIPHTDELFGLLSKALLHEERIIRFNAIIATNYLIRLKQPGIGVDLILKLSRAQAKYRLYGISALISQVENGYTLSETATLRGILDSLEHDNILMHKVRFLKFLLDGNLHVLLTLLRDPDFAIEASMALLSSVKKGLQLPDDIIDTTQYILRSRYPKEAIFNLFLAFVTVAQSPKGIAPQIIQDAVGYFIRCDSIDTLNIMLKFFGSCPCEKIQLYFNSKAYNKLKEAIGDKARAHNASFLLANILKNPSGLSDHILSQLMRIISEQLGSDHDVAVKNNLVTAFLLASRFEGGLLSEVDFQQLLRVVQESPAGNHRAQALEIFSNLIEHKRIVNPRLIDRVLGFLVECLRDDQEEIRYKAEQALCILIESNVISSSANHLSVLLKPCLEQHSLGVQHAVAVLKALALAKFEIDPDILIVLWHLLDHYQVLQRFEISSIFENVSQYQHLPEDAVRKILTVGLRDFHHGIVENYIKSLKNWLVVELFAIDFLHSQARLITESMTAILLVERHSERKSLLVVQVIKLISNYGCIIPLSMLIDLTALLSHESQKVRLEIALILREQIKHLSFSFAHNKASINHLLNGLHPYLIDDSACAPLVDTLTEAQSYGYQLTTTLITMLGKILKFSQNPHNRKSCFGALTLVSEKKRSKAKVNDLYIFEKYSLRLISRTETAPKKRKAMTEMSAMVRGHQAEMSPACFDVLKTFLDEKEVLASASISLCISAIESGQTLPKAYTEKFLLYMRKLESSRKITPKAYENAIHLLAIIIHRDGQYCSEEILHIVQRYVTQEKKLAQKDGLNILQVCVKRGMALQLRTQAKLIHLVQHGPDDQVQIAMDILAHIAIDGIRDKADIFINMLKKKQTVSIRKAIVSIIEKLSQVTSISEASRKIMSDYISQEPDYTIQERWARILDEGDAKTTLLVKIQHNKSCHFFHETSRALDDQVAVFSLLVSHHYFFQPRDVARAVELLEELFAAHERDGSLLIDYINSFCDMRLKKFAFGDTFMSRIVEIYTQSNSGALIDAIIQLLRFLSSQQIAKQYRKTIAHIISLSEVESHERYTDLVLHQTPLSSRDISKLIQELPKSTVEVQHAVIQLLYQNYRDNIPADTQERLLEYVFDKVYTSEHAWHDSVVCQFIQYIVTHFSPNSATLNALIQTHIIQKNPVLGSGSELRKHCWTVLKEKASQCMSRSKSLRLSLTHYHLDLFVFLQGHIQNAALVNYVTDQLKDIEHITDISLLIKLFFTVSAFAEQMTDESDRYLLSLELVKGIHHLLKVREFTGARFFSDIRFLLLQLLGVFTGYFEGDLEGKIGFSSIEAETYFKALTPFISDQYVKIHLKKPKLLDSLNDSTALTLMLLGFKLTSKHIEAFSKVTDSAEGCMVLLQKGILQDIARAKKGEKAFFEGYCRYLNIKNQHMEGWPKQYFYFLLHIQRKQEKELLDLAHINDLLFMRDSYDSHTLFNQFNAELIQYTFEDNQHMWMSRLLESLFPEIPFTRRGSMLEKFKLSHLSVGVLSEIFDLTKRRPIFGQLEDIMDFLREMNIEQVDLVSQLEKQEDQTLIDLKNHLMDMLFSKVSHTLVSHLVITEYRDDVETLKALKKMELRHIILSLFQRKWSMQKLMNLLDNAAKFFQKTKLSVDRFNTFLSALECPNNYDMSEEAFYRHFEIKHLHESIVSFRRSFAEKYFKANVVERSLDELITEIKRSAQKLDHCSMLSLLDSHIITKTLQESYQMSIGTQSITSGYEHEHDLVIPIKNWDIDDIKRWSEHIKQRPDPLYHLSEMIAVIKRACILHFSYEPRYTQLIALICLIQKPVDFGRFAQVSTGEGKSLIIAMLAIINALTGRTVDVVTSNYFLAKRDAKALRSFYKIFHLSVGSNEEQKQGKGVKSCYRNIHIVYGDASNFQFDILRDEYSLLETRGTRGFEAVIIDEVDNLLIDENNKIAMLAAQIPGMEHLKNLLSLVWLRLLRLVSEKTQPSKALEYGDEHIDQAELEAELVKYIRLLLSQTGPNAIPLPRKLNQFVRIQVGRWAQSAVAAYFHYKENRNYTLQYGEGNRRIIVPVDFANTGVLQSGTTWSNGLQQFLQLKHGLDVTAESLTTNFLSNIALVKRYSHLYGLTGTLGSEASKALLNKVYQIDYVEIPTYKPKPFFELTGAIMALRPLWINTIVRNAKREAYAGRVVLIVCETIEDADDIFEAIHPQYSGRLEKYTTGSSTQDQFLDELVSGNSIIVATNLAGRGTDIRMTESVIKAGGLHVCCTFLPENKRVETQVFGRCARQGQPGTAQLILNQQDLFTKGFNSDNTTELKQVRDSIEKQELSEIWENEVPRILAKDELFQNFLGLIKKIREMDRDKTPYQIVLRDWGVNLSMVEEFAAITASYKRKALEERWGIWLKQITFDADRISKKSGKSMINIQFEAFEAKMLAKYLSGKIMKSADHYIHIGNHFLKRSDVSWVKKPFIRISEYQKIAIKCYESAIDREIPFAYMAYYYKAYTLIKQQAADYKANAKRCLKASKSNLLENVATFTQSMSNVVEGIHELSRSLKRLEKNTRLSDLSGYIQDALHMQHAIIESIDQAIKVVEKSERLIDVSFHVPSGDSFYQKLDRSMAVKIIKDASIRERTSGVTVSLHDLAKHEDLGDNYPALDIFKKCRKKFSQMRLSVEYDSERLDKARTAKESLLKLLPINRKLEIKAEGEESKTEPTAESESKEIIGTRERLSHISGKVGSAFSKGMSVFSQVGHGLNRVYQLGEESYYNYKKAEKIPVSVEVRNIPCQQAAELLNVAQKFQREPAVEIDATPHYGLTVLQPSPGVVRLMCEDAALRSRAYVKYIESENPELMQAKYRSQSLSVESYPEKADTLYQTDRLNQIARCVEFFLGKTTHSDEKDLIYLNLSFHNIPQQLASQLFEIPMNRVIITYHHLKYSNAERIIYLTADQYNHACFHYDNLSAAQAQQFVRNADRKVQDLEVSYRPIQTEFAILSSASPDLLRQYVFAGTIILFDLMEKNPYPWKSMALVSGLSLLQIAGGLALMTFTGGFAANVGLGLITEGVADLLRVAAAGYTRQLSIQSYLAQKSLSMTISLATAGWSTMTASSKGASQVMNQADEAATAITYLAQARTAGTRVGMQVAESSVSHAVREGCTRMGKRLAASSRENNLKYANSIVERHLYADLWKQRMQKCFAADRVLFEGRHEPYKDRLLQCARKSINALPYAIPNAKVFDLNGLDGFFEGYTRSSADIEQEIDQFDSILKQKLRLTYEIDLTDEKVKDLIATLKTKGLFDGQTGLNLSAASHYLSVTYDPRKPIVTEMEHYNLEGLDLGKPEFNAIKQQVFEICLLYHNLLTHDDYSVRYRKFIAEVAQEYANVLQSSVDFSVGMVSSLVASGINYGVSKAANKIEKSIESSGVVEAETLEQNLAEQQATSSSAHEIKKRRKMLSKLKRGILKARSSGAGVDVDDIVETWDGLDDMIAAPVQVKTVDPKMLPKGKGSVDSPAPLKKPSGSAQSRKGIAMRGRRRPTASPGRKVSSRATVSPKRPSGTQIKSRGIKSQGAFKFRSIIQSSGYILDKAFEHYNRTRFRMELNRRIDIEMIYDQSFYDFWSQVQGRLCMLNKDLSVYVSILLYQAYRSNYTNTGLSDLLHQESLEDFDVLIEKKTAVIVKIITNDRGAKAAIEYLSDVLRLEKIDADEVKQKLRLCIIQYYEIKHSRLKAELRKKYDDIGLRKTVNTYVTFLDSGKHQEAGKLLQEGSLGSFGYIASCALTGFFESQKRQTRLNNTTKCFMFQVAQEVIHCQKQVQEWLGDEQERKTRVLNSVHLLVRSHAAEHYHEMSHCLAMQLSELFQESNGANREKKIKELEAQLNAQNARLKTDGWIAEGIAKASKRYAVDPGIVTQCFNRSNEIIARSVEWIKKIHIDSSESSSFIARARSVLLTAAGGATRQVPRHATPSFSLSHSEQREKASSEGMEYKVPG